MNRISSAIEPQLVIGIPVSPFLFSPPFFALFFHSLVTWNPFSPRFASFLVSFFPHFFTYNCFRLFCHSLLLIRPFCVRSWRGISLFNSDWWLVQSQAEFWLSTQITLISPVGRPACACDHRRTYIQIDRHYFNSQRIHHICGEA